MNVSFTWNTSFAGEENTIQTYVQEIQETVKVIGDCGTLDHIIAKLLLIGTTIHTRLDLSLTHQGQIPENFNMMDRFAPT